MDVATSEQCASRLIRLYNAWTKADADDPVIKVDAMVVAVGDTADIPYSKSTALHMWLFG